MPSPTPHSESPSPHFQSWQERTKSWRAKYQPKTGIQMRGSELELSMLGTIGYDWWTDGGITSSWVKRQLDANPDVRFVRVLLNSPGGDYFEGVAIHNLLKRCGAKVIVEIIGEAASAASIIAMAGEEVQIHHGAMLMVHEAWTCCCGNATEFESTAEMLRKVNASAVDIYVDRTGLDRAKVEELVARTTWLGADEAVADGWADKVIPTGSKPERGSATAVSPPENQPPAPPAASAKQLNPLAAAQSAAAFRQFH